MRIFLTILLCLISVEAHACIYVVSKLTHDELIQNAETIVLAKVVSAEIINDDQADYWNRWARHINYNFEVKEILKGESEKKFTIQGRPLLFSSDVNDFKDKNDYKEHSSEEFWIQNRGRAPYNCEMIYDAYAVGADYLLFTNIKNSVGSHPKEKEVINSDNDKWLEYVRNKVNE